MPELPEVELAARLARRLAVGRGITSVRVLHPAQRRTLPARAARSLAGDRVTAVERRGKEQRFRLASGRMLRVHFRMTGDWIALPPEAPLPRTVRALLAFDDGGRLALDDPRALSVLSLCDGPAADDGLGPEATDPALTGERLGAALGRRRVAVKVALLDQRVVAGVGNIYASEALWRARIDPRTPAGRLTSRRLNALAAALRATMAAALRRGERYDGRQRPASEERFTVYDRDGQPCRRCRRLVRRIVQAGRSTYYCGNCQR